jgi:hypothetical protein
VNPNDLFITLSDKGELKVLQKYQT